jgi:hypothetical protein
MANEYFMGLLTGVAIALSVVAIITVLYIFWGSLKGREYRVLRDEEGRIIGVEYG